MSTVRIDKVIALFLDYDQSTKLNKITNNMINIIETDYWIDFEDLDNLKEEIISNNIIREEYIEEILEVLSKGEADYVALRYDH